MHSLISISYQLNETSKHDNKLNYVTYYLPLKYFPLFLYWNQQIYNAVFLILKNALRNKLKEIIKRLESSFYFV